jgi:hypothetical protein
VSNSTSTQAETMGHTRWRVPPHLCLRMPRLHRSTYVVVALVAAALLLANIPGQIIRPIDDTFAPPRICHGWPCTFLRRTVDDQPLITPNDDQPLTTQFSRDRLIDAEQGVLWQLARDVEEVTFSYLVSDIAVALVLLGGGTALFEAWRRRRARLLQFHLFELLTLVTLASALFSWLAVEVREHREEQNALSQMSQFLHDEDRAGPHWLRQLVGPWPFEVFDRADRVVIITTHHDSVFGFSSIRVFKDYEQLSHLRHLRALDCGAESAEILRFLPRPDRLEVLHIGSSQEGLLDLRRFPNLRTLRLGDITQLQHFFGSDMAHLAALGRLRSLSLDGVYNVDDKWLSYLKGLSRLEVLTVPHPEITDAGVGHVSGLRNLKHLNLSHTSLSDAGLQYLTQLERLERLELEDTKVTDRGLQHLTGLERLQVLNLGGTRVTAEGVKRLQQALPNCRIETVCGEIMRLDTVL